MFFPLFDWLCDLLWLIQHLPSTTTSISTINTQPVGLFLSRPKLTVSFSKY
nr:hypothetical protein Iba_chr09bCG1860 [Ipomoea batatas]